MDHNQEAVIDVKKIMDEIKAQIEAEGLKDDLPAFSQVKIHENGPVEDYSIQDINGAMEKLKEYASIADERKYIDAVYPIEGSFLKRNTKKILHRLCRSSLFPVTERVSQENMYISQCINLLTAIVDKQQKTISELEKKFDSMQKGETDQK